MPSTPKRSARRAESRDPRGPDPLNELFGDVPERLRGEFWKPAVDIFETESAVVVRLEMAGVRGEDLRVNLDGDQVRIRGIRRAPEAPGMQRLHQMEIAQGPFERSVRVAIAFDKEGVNAHLEDGVLEVTLPKARAVRVAVDVEVDGSEGQK